MKALKAFAGKGKRSQVVFILCLVITIVVEQWARLCGLIMTSDSWQYVSASVSFRDNGNFLSPDGSDYAVWPPLFPVILSLFEEPQKAMAWIGFLSKAMIALCIFYVSRVFQKDIFRMQYLMVVLLGVHLLLISVFLWSEVIFFVLMLSNVVLTLSMKQRPANFYFMLVTGFLCCLQRNAGLFIVAGTCLWFLLDTDTLVHKRAGRAAIYFLICTSGQWIWNIYSLQGFMSETVMSGSWLFSAIPANIFIVLSFTGKLFLPLSGPPAFVTGAVIFIIVLVVLRKAIVTDTALQLIFCLIICYGAGYVILPALDPYESDRYFSVIVPFILLMFFKALEAIYRQMKVPRYMLITMIFIWMIYPLSRTAKNALLWHERSCAPVSDK